MKQIKHTCSVTNNHIFDFLFNLTKTYSSIILGPPATEPRHALDVGNKPGTDEEDNGQQYQHIVVSAVDAAPEAQVHKLIIV